MSSRPAFLVSTVACALAVVALFAVFWGLGSAEAESSSGYTAGPWHCESFKGDQIEQRAATWLFRYASTGPSAVVSLAPTAAGARAANTLCAWNPAFAADHWVEEEKARRAHEAEVLNRKRKLQKHKQEGRDELFPDDVPLEEDEAGDKP